MSSTAPLHAANPPLAPSALLLQRAEVLQHSPQLFSLYDEVVAHLHNIETPLPLCPGVTVATEELYGLLQPHWQSQGIPDAVVTPRLLVLYAPPDYASALGALVVSVPGIFNFPNPDLFSTNTYFAWSSSGTGAGASQAIWVDEREMFNLLERPAGLGEQRWGWLPVVVVSGEVVAVGGFVVDAETMDCAQATAMSRQSYRPWQVYDEATLSEAAETALRTDPNPMIYVPWQVNDWSTVKAMVFNAGTPYE